MKNKENFKKELKLIEIETFSYCNRVCWFCPNSFIDRRSINHIMPIEVYEGILNQLGEINYSGEITYSRYNEPLAHKEIILDRLERARKLVPNSVLRINTNGDYITREYIEQLRNSGLNQLWIQQYLKNDEKYNHERSMKETKRKIKKLGYEAELIVEIKDYKIEYNLLVDGMTVHIRARNFEVDGSSRGGTVPISEDYIRTKPCEQPKNNMYIDYNGKVMICCALRSDVKEHDYGIMADHVMDQPIWDLFYNEKYLPWRQMHSNNDEKPEPCKTCKIGI